MLKKTPLRHYLRMQISRSFTIQIIHSSNGSRVMLIPVRISTRIIVLRSQATAPQMTSLARLSTHQISQSDVSALLLLSQSQKTKLAGPFLCSRGSSMKSFHFCGSIALLFIASVVSLLLNQLDQSYPPCSVFNRPIVLCSISSPLVNRFYCLDLPGFNEPPADRIHFTEINGSHLKGFDNSIVSLFIETFIRCYDYRGTNRKTTKSLPNSNEC